MKLYYISKFTYSIGVSTRTYIRDKFWNDDYNNPS